MKLKLNDEIVIDYLKFMKMEIIPTLIFHLFYHKTWSLFLLYQNCDTQNWCNGSIIVAPITPCLILSFSYYNNEMKSDIFHICTPKFTIQRCGKKKIMVVSVAVKMTKKKKKNNINMEDSYTNKKETHKNYER